MKYKNIHPAESKKELQNLNMAYNQIPKVKVDLNAKVNRRPWMMLPSKN